MWQHMGLAEVYRPFARPNIINYSYNTIAPAILPRTVAIGQYRYGTAQNRYQTTSNYLHLDNWREPVQTTMRGS